MNRAASRDFTQLRPALRFVRPYIRQVVIASVALVVTALVTLSVGLVLRLVIDNGLGGATGDGLQEAVAGFALLMTLLTVGTFVRFYYVSWVGERVSADIRRAVFDHLVHLHPGFFEDNRPTEIQSRITTDTTLLQTVIGSSVSIALRNVLMFLGGLVLLFWTNPKLSMVVILSVPFVVAPVVLFGRRVRRLSRDSQDKLADVGSYAGESLRHIKIVQSFNHQERDVVHFAERVQQAFAVAVRRIRQRSWLVAMVMLLVMAALTTMLWIGGQDVVDGVITPGDLAAFIFFAFIVAGSVGAISEVYSDLQRAAGAMERLLELLDSRSVLAEPPSPKLLQEQERPRVLHFDGVSFTYPSRPNAQVLHNVSFSVASGEMVALVGPSGAGKSTLLDLAQRFYDPTEGRIRLDEYDLRDLTLRDVRGYVGYVPQDPVLFAGSVESNLRYSSPDRSESELWTALESANAAEFVRQLPQGLATQLGESGVGLSGGQRQRLAIARALLDQPALLLLDEATSALDADSENAIRASIDALQGRCSLLVVAHRLSTVRQADRIVVLQGGEIAAAGSHDELIASNELYARFARIQFAANGASASAG